MTQSSRGSAVYQLSLDFLTVRKNGTRKRRYGHNLLTVSLLNPRPGAAVVSVGKGVRLRERDSMHLDGDAEAQNPVEASWHDRLLLKEALVGDAHLLVQLTQSECPLEIEKLSRYFGVEGLEGGFDPWPEPVATVFYQESPQLNRKIQLDALNPHDNPTVVVGRGEMHLAAGALPRRGGSVSYELPLRVPKGEQIFRCRWDAQGRIVDSDELTLERGEVNGAIGFTVNRLQ
ncbi:MAG: hypothetical protein AAGD01_17065 [Acidobacteriota bacterium]